ncbi:MAG: alpha/beta hydrolase [Desulfobacteraceae bacterium]|nr:alpha/beta hydrolase [Desulfobacteraceae bacterium]
MADKIVMIHGMWGGGWCWENFKNFFEQRGYECFTPTLRLHDVSPLDDPHPDLGETSLLDYAQDLEKFIRNLDEKPILIGHSMGGLLAQILGSRGLAKAIVLLTSASPSGVNALKFSVIKSFWSILTTWGFWRKPQRLSFKTAVYSILHLLSEEEQRDIYDKFVYESGRAAGEIGFWLLDFTGASKVDQSKVTCPVLIISGAEDRMTPVSLSKKMAKKYNGTYKEFENHAHWVIMEPGWEEISEYIASWLNQIKGQRPES